MLRTEVKSPSLKVTIDPAVPEGLASQFAHFIGDHPEDTRAFLEVTAGTPLLVKVAAGDARGLRRTKEDGQEVVSLSQEQVRFILARAEIRQLCGGMFVIPTLYHLAKAGTFELIEKSDGISIEALAGKLVRGDPGKNMGYLLGAMRMLALHTWVELKGVDEQTTLRLTEHGRILAKLLRDNWGALEQVVAAIPQAKEYYRLARVKDGSADAAATAYASLVKASGSGWAMKVPPGPSAERIARQLRTLLDGAVVSPTLIAFDMPPMTLRDDKLVNTGPALFELLSEPSGRLDMDQAERAFNPVFLEAGLDLLVGRGILSRDAKDPRDVRINAWGRAVRNTIGQTGISGAYLKGYELFDEVLFGNPDPMCKAEDGHIDRLVNIWGSSGISEKLAIEVCEEVMRRIFDETPLDKQPAGIADMGCGEGKFLAKLVDYVLKKTRRGASLAEYPLVVVAADFFDTPLRRARDTLSVFQKTPGVVLSFIRGDVGNPEKYDADLQAAGLTWRGRTLGAGDFVHTMVFLAHDRALSLFERKEALEVLRRCVRTADRATLAVALERAVGEPVVLPEDPEALLNLVLSQFTVSFANQGRLIPAMTAAADFVRFLERWGRFGKHGVVLTELHIPRHTELQSETSDDPAAFLRADMYGLNMWGYHYWTDQYPLPFKEHHLAASLAGMKPADGKIHGANLYFTNDRQNSIVWYQSAPRAGAGS